MRARRPALSTNSNASRAFTSYAQERCRAVRAFSCDDRASVAVNLVCRVRHAAPDALTLARWCAFKGVVATHIAGLASVLDEVKREARVVPAADAMGAIVRAILVFIFCVVSALSAGAETCSGRANLCLAACTPQNVSSGAQHGGTVSGCRASCQSRLKNCMTSGVWVHMGSQTKGQRQQVDRR
jgi:hypothetical protein